MEWVIGLFNLMISFFYSLFLSVPEMFKDLFYWILDQLMGVMDWAANLLLTMFAPLNISEYLSAIPPNISWVFMTIGLPNCLMIIGAAIVIRLTLQLIPFVRLGS